jgi:hypothetical protein
MPKYDPENNPGFAPDAYQDFRWRLLPVSPDDLNTLVRGGTIERPGAPADLVLLTVHRITLGGWWEFLVWSESFAPMPNDGKHRLDETPFTGPDVGWT